MMLLVFAKSGDSFIIKKICGNPETKKHLKNLGFIVGGEVSVINENEGDMIVNVKESRIAVSKELAQQIMV